MLTHSMAFDFSLNQLPLAMITFSHITVTIISDPTRCLQMHATLKAFVFFEAKFSSFFGLNLWNFSVLLTSSLCVFSSSNYYRCLLNKKASTLMKIITDILCLILKVRTQLISSSWVYDQASHSVIHPAFQTIKSSYLAFKDYSGFLYKGKGKSTMSFVFKYKTNPMCNHIINFLKPSSLMVASSRIYVT